MVLAVIALLYVAAALLYIAVNRKNSLTASLASGASAIAQVQHRDRSATRAAKPTANAKPKTLLEPSQRLFYEALKQAAAGRDLFAKIRVADLLKAPHADDSTALIDFEKIANRHLDFIICRSDSLTVLAAIRLHAADCPTAEATAEDKMIRNACKREKISLLVIKEDKSYDIEQLKRLIALLR